MGVLINDRARGVAQLELVFPIFPATGIQKVLKSPWNLQVHLRMPPFI